MYVCVFVCVCVFDMCSFSWKKNNPSSHPVLRTAQAEILAMPAMEEREKLESFWFKFQLLG